MTFEQALTALKQGRKARRRYWDDLGQDWTVEIAAPVLPDGRHVRPILLCRGNDGAMIPFTGGAWDLLADDWVIA